MPTLYTPLAQARQHSVPRFSLLVLTAFGALAWVIAAAGVFGVLAYPD